MAMLYFKISAEGVEQGNREIGEGTIPGQGDAEGRYDTGASGKSGRKIG